MTASISETGLAQQTQVSCLSYGHLTLIIQQHVLRLEVSVDDPLLVEVLHALDDLSSVVAGPRLVKAGVVLVHVVDVIPGRVMITACLFSMLQ